MFADYQQLVIQDFERKKANNELSLRLIHATPAKLKQECLEVYSTRLEKKDENTIKGFFGEAAAGSNYVQVIERCDTDKFRPLINFLRGSIINTDVRNIELLAWLINFEPRPWQFQKKYAIGGAENPGTVDTPVTVNNSNNNTVSNIYQTLAATAIERTKPKRRKVAVPILVAALLGTAGYTIWNKTAGNSNHESCMYWNGVRYEKISCKENLPHATVIGFDEYRFENFKKIMRPDTLNYSNAIGKVWYAKSNNKCEFFTADGNHPTNPALELKRISRYIISNHILKDSLYLK